MRKLFILLLVLIFNIDYLHASSEKQFAESHNKKGIVNSYLENEQEAIFHFTKAIELDPNFVKAYHNRSKEYYLLGDKKQAFEDLNKAIKLDPKLAKAYNNRGILNFEFGNLLEAISDFTKAIELDPKLAEAYNNLAIVRNSLGDNKVAVELFVKAIKLNYNLAILKNRKKKNFSAISYPSIFDAIFNKISEANRSKAKKIVELEKKNTCAAGFELIK